MTRLRKHIRISLLLLLVIMVTTMPVRGLLNDQFIFFPDPDLVATPALFDLDFEDVRFAAADGTLLNGWLIPTTARAPLVLFCMGNAGNMSHRLDNLKQLHDLGLNVFIFDYRGYGQSQGKADEAGTYQDIRAAIDWLDQRGFGLDQLIYFGRSLGAAIALQAALERPPAGLIMEAPFTSISGMGWAHYPLLYALGGWLIDLGYNNLEKIDTLQCPLLILHGRKDTICPPGMAEKLFKRAPEPKKLVWLEQAGHNDTIDRGGQLYWESWREFLTSLKTSKRHKPQPVSQ